MGFGKRENLRGDLVQRLIPGDSLPFAGAARAAPLQRIVEPIGRIMQLRRLRAFGADEAGCSRVLAITHQSHHLSTSHNGDMAALLSASEANGVLLYRVIVRHRRSLS
nr:hypothetical protein [Sphingopyxis indica]